jgi:hypothetical protein
MYFAIVFNIRPIILLISVAGGVVNILRAGQKRIRGSVSGGSGGGGGVGVGGGGKSSLLSITKPT